MPKPSEWHNHPVEKPKDDNEYFERMSKVVFAAGLNWATLEKKWPGIRQAFDGFDIATVTDYDEQKIDALMADPAVIRNLLKIRAVVGNAAKMQEIAREHGSFGQYLGKLAVGGEDALKADISKQFAFMGKGTTVIFLFSVGVELPRTVKEWHDRR